MFAGFDLDSFQFISANGEIEYKDNLGATAVGFGIGPNLNRIETETVDFGVSDLF